MSSSQFDTVIPRLMKGLRLLVGLLGIGLLWASFFPELALWPIKKVVEQMRAPHTAVQSARIVFIAGAVLFVILFIFWRRVCRGVQAYVQWVSALSDGKFWGVVAVCATLPRLLIAAAVSYTPTSDAAWYHEAALSLADANRLAVGGELTAFRSPGYPFLLSLTYRWFGADLAWAWFWGVITTVGILAGVHSIGLRLYDRLAARLATLTASLYPALVVMTGQSLSDLAFVAGSLLLTSFALSRREASLGDAAFVGMGAGVLALLRGVGVGLFIIIPLLWLVRGPAVPIGIHARRFLVAGLLYAVCVTPWMWRNNEVFGSFTLGTNIGANAYVGNHPGASGGVDRYTPPQFPPEAYRDEARYDRALLGAALDFVRSQPLEALKILPGKLLSLYLLETETVTSLFQGENAGPFGLKLSLYGVSQFAYVLILLMVAARVASLLLSDEQRPHGAQWTPWILIAYFTLICLIFHGEDRYRLPILPWLLIEGSVGLALLTRQPRPSNR